MQLTTATLQALQTTVTTAFQAAYQATPLTYPRFTMTVTSSTKTATYGWLARMQKMRQWLGPRQIQNLSTYSTQLTNLTYEATLGLDREEIEDDMLGLFNARIQELAEKGAYFPQQVVLDAIAANATTFDGKAFFATDHTLSSPSGGSAQSNLGTDLFSPAGWNAVRTRMTVYVGEDGLPMGVRPNLVLIPPEYERMAKYIFKLEKLPGASDNPQYNEADYVVIPEWAGLSQWFALDTSKAIKPFLFQDRKPLELVSKTALTDDNMFFNRELIWGVDARGAAMGTVWWLAHKSTGGIGAISQPPLGTTADWGGT